MQWRGDGAAIAHIDCGPGWGGDRRGCGRPRAGLGILGGHGIFLVQQPIANFPQFVVDGIVQGKGA